MDITVRKPSISRQTLAVLCLLSAAPALAAADLQARVDAFVGAEGSAPLDARTARDCAQPPAIDWYGSLHRSVTITCAGAPGWRLFVPLRANAAQRANSAPAFAPVVVKRGDPVQIHAGGPGFNVTAEGSAEQDGRVGGHIRVRNLGTDKVTAAVVESAGNVSLPGYSSGPVGR